MNLSKENVKKIIFIIFGAILFYEILENIGNIVICINKIISILFPFILGGAIAFIINVPMKHIEKHLFMKRKGEKIKTVRRATALFITITAFLGVIAFAMWIVIPEIAHTVSDVSEKIPGLVEKTTDKLVEMTERYPKLGSVLESEEEVDWNEVFNIVVNKLENGAGAFVSSGISIVGSVISGITSFLIAVVFSIYVLFQKEKLSNQVKQVMYSFLSRKMTERIIRIGNIADQTFSSFLSGQCLEACILGTMFFVTMSILRLPYALMMGVVIAITALIPIVGAFIGCFIGAILIFIDSPVKALVFVIMFLVLQQIEGNLIYPHVVGNSVGLPSIWVLVAVTIGGDLMGVLGMIIFIPICSILYALFRDLVKRRLNEKKIKI